jgi:transposase-like protein
MQSSAQDRWSAYIFSTKFKQRMPFCIISWSDSKHFRPSDAFFAEWWLRPTSADWQGQYTVNGIENINRQVTKYINPSTSYSYPAFAHCALCVSLRLGATGQ